VCPVGQNVSALAVFIDGRYVEFADRQSKAPHYASIQNRIDPGSALTTPRISSWLSLLYRGLRHAEGAEFLVGRPE